MEDELRVVTNTGDVDGDQVLTDLLPLDGPAAAGGDVEDLGPESGRTNIKTGPAWILCSA